MLHDIVYILKEDVDPSELRYSLRSIEKNFPHNKVWFVCGQPKGFEPDGRITHKQSGSTKWAWIRSSMYEVIKNDDVTEDFFLFNDDFFVMKPFAGDFINYVDGTLERRINELHDESGMSPYCRTLYKAQQELITLGKPTMNYDVHLPMLMNKEKVLASIGQCSSPQMRSVYGNINEIEYVLHPDVKIGSLDIVPKSPDFLSTNERSFNEGKVGAYIRSRFRAKSRFEVNG